MSMDPCPRCGNYTYRCVCPSPARPMQWNGLVEYGGFFDLNDHIKAFSEKVTGHIPREFRYRAFAAHLLAQLPALRNTMTPESAQLLTSALEAWHKELDDIAKL